MDSIKLQQICKQLTKSLTPSRVEVLELTNNSFTLRVVSDQFAKMQHLGRFKLLSMLFEDGAPEIISSYVFDFEAWTLTEFAELEKTGKIEGTPQTGTPSGVAAKNPEI